MKPIFRHTVLALCLLLTGVQARAQYYSQGQDPFSTRWGQYKTDRYRLIYPEGNEADARKVSLVLDTAYHALCYGFSRPPARLPILLHTQNLRSNGVVSWTPRRGELIATPQSETYAVPWLKQLSVHEYRHVVQMSNLNRRMVRFFSRLLGEQAPGAAAVFIPQWFLEGDAVLAETAMSTYGRALQPEFTIAYRAYLAGQPVDRFPLDKWFCGSYRDYIPNHYQYGYLMVNKGYKLYGPEMWERTFDYVTGHPYLLFPRPIAFKRFYRTTGRQLFNETFAELKALWDALPEVKDNVRFIPVPVESYTIYSYPLPAGEGSVIAHKSDFSRTDRLVAVHAPTGEERVLAWTGAVSSRPALAGNALYWTEYRASTFWEQKNRSVVRRLPLGGSARAKTIRHSGNLFYVTPYRNGFAAVSYDPERKYAVELFDAAFSPLETFRLPGSMTVHGLAWDEKSDVLALITLTEEGMALTAVNPGEKRLQPLTPPSFTTINHLTARDGKLYFNSIRSGRDEVHCFDLSQRKEFRLTSSRFGSKMPAPGPDGTTVQVTYREQGYLLSELAPGQAAWEEAPTSGSPVNLVNPAVYDFGLPDLDEISLFAETETDRLPSRPYRKGTHLFNFHSWAPVGFDVLEAAGNRNLEPQAGITLITQNDLSNTEGYLSYGYVNDRSWWRGGFRFLAMAPKFGIDAEYGGGKRPVAGAPRDMPPPPGWADKDYFSVGGRVYLPFNLSSGATVRGLTPSLSLTHYNTAIYLPETRNFVSGYEKSEFSLAYSQYRRMAYRDLAPRLGFGVTASVGAAPFDRNFATLWSLYGNLYLPGVAVNHSLRLRGAVQGQDLKTYHFSSNVLFPRGVEYGFAPERLGSALADYRFPIAYPDRGIDGVVFIKRISADLFGGYARYRTVQGPEWYTVYSCGGEVSIDFNPRQMTGAGFTFRAALYRASGREGLGSRFGLSVNL